LNVSESAVDGYCQAIERLGGAARLQILQALLEERPLRGNIMATKVNAFSVVESFDGTGTGRHMKASFQRKHRTGRTGRDFNGECHEDIVGLVSIVAPTTINVLVHGGIESQHQWIARTIHDFSHRSQDAFICVDCASLSADRFESELLGTRGRTDNQSARSEPNCFELAHRGTLFLNNIEGIPLGVQRKLLRILQNREVGEGRGRRCHKIDIRLIAASSRNLPIMVRHRLFDEELYYLLKVFPIDIPSAHLAC
jgi:DNA-binding NtrC family response regulator